MNPDRTLTAQEMMWVVSEILNLDLPQEEREQFANKLFAVLCGLNRMVAEDRGIGIESELAPRLHIRYAWLKEAFDSLLQQRQEIGVLPGLTKRAIIVDMIERFVEDEYPPEYKLEVLERFESIVTGILESVRRGVQALQPDYTERVMEHSHLSDERFLTEHRGITPTS